MLTKFEVGKQYIHKHDNPRVVYTCICVTENNALIQWNNKYNKNKKEDDLINKPNWHYYVEYEPQPLTGYVFFYTDESGNGPCASFWNGNSSRAKGVEFYRETECTIIAIVKVDTKEGKYD